MGMGKTKSKGRHRDREKKEKNGMESTENNEYVRKVWKVEGISEEEWLDIEDAFLDRDLLVYEDLTTFEKWRIRKSQVGTIKDLCKKFKISKTTYHTVVGNSRLNNERIKQRFYDGRVLTWENKEELKSRGYSVNKVLQCLRGKRLTYKHSRWFWATKPNVKVKRVYRKRLSYKEPKVYKKHTKAMGRAVLQYDLDGNFIKEYRTVSDAAKAVGASQGNISNCVRCRVGFASAMGYKWKYKYKLYKSKKFNTKYTKNGKKQ